MDTTFVVAGSIRREYILPPVGMPLLDAAGGSVMYACGGLLPWATREHTRNLVADLEDSYFRLIRTNIQLLSLKEVGRSVIAPLDRERTVQSVLDYLHRGIGFSEFGLFTWRPEEGVFDGGVRRHGTSGDDWLPLRFALPEADGILAKSVGLRRSYLIKDADAHPLGTL